MNAHDIDPLKYGGNRSDDYVTGWNDCYAAIEADRKRRELPDTSFDHWLDRHGYDTSIGADGDYADTDVAMLHEAYRLGSQRRGEPVAWLDMKTAPKDGTAVLVLIPDSNIPKAVRWRSGCWEMTWDGHQLSEYDQPRYWMPCPSDPDAPAAPVAAPAPPADEHRVNPTVEPELDTLPVTPEEEEEWQRRERG